MKKFERSLKTILRANEDASTYMINSGLEQLFTDCNKEPFLVALKQVIEAYGGIGEVAGLTNLNRQHLYKMLSDKGNPSFINISLLLAAIGLRLRVESSGAFMD